MQKKVLVLAISAICASNAYAQGVVIENEYIKAGVGQTTGTLGIGHTSPPGIQYDPTGSGTFSNSFDFLTPGNPFDGFTVRITDSSGSVLHSYTNNNSMQLTGIANGAWVGTPTPSSAVWAGSTPEFAIQHTYSLPSMQTYIDINTRIEAYIAMPKLYFGRFIDPDTRTIAGDTAATDNVLGYGAIPTRNVVFSEAIVSRAALGLYSAAPNVGAGIGGGTNHWTTNPAVYYSGYSPYTDSSGATVNFGRGDHTIGLGFLVENLSVGDIVTFSYAYIFGPSAFGAASGAVLGGAGGGTPGSVPGGGTLTDVGSATSAASSSSTPSSPTLVSSTTTNRVGVSESVITTLPVITGSIAHHTASEGSGIQTIARQTTTAVTTPWLRTTTTTPVTTNLYSDGTSTITDGSSVVTEELFNIVDMSELNEAFSGRIDQHDKLARLNQGLNRGLNMDAYRNDGVCANVDKSKDPQCKDGVRVFVNGGLSTSSLTSGYNADSKVFGIGIDFGVTNNWRLGLQGNRVTTKMAGVDSLTQQDKNHVGVYSIYALNGFTLVNNLGYSMDSVHSNRNIEGVFFNEHSVDGNSKWLQNRLYSPTIAGVNPFVGYTYGRNSRSAYIEAGSIQSARAVDAAKDSSSYAEAGLRIGQSFGKLSLTGEVSTASDSFKVVDVSASYTILPGAVLSVAASRQIGDGVATNSVALRAVARF